MSLSKTKTIPYRGEFPTPSDEVSWPLSNISVRISYPVGVPSLFIHDNWSIFVAGSKTARAFVLKKLFPADLLVDTQTSRAKRI